MSAPRNVRHERETASADAPSVRAGSMPAPRVELGVLHTLPGRLFLLSSGLLFAVWIANHLIATPDVVEVFRKVVSLAWLVSGGWVVVAGLVRNRHRLLWRVRRKLILSYVFLGVIPVVLVTVFVLASGQVLYDNIATYLFHEGLERIVERAREIAATTEAQIAQDPASAAVVLGMRARVLDSQYPGLSLAMVPAAGGTPVLAGPWRHLDAPADVPPWAAAKGFAGLVAVRVGGSNDDGALVARALAPLPAGGAVVVDVPIDTAMVARLHDETGTRIMRITITASNGARGLPTRQPGAAAPDGAATAPSSLFRQTVAFMDFTDWTTGAIGKVSIRLDAPVAALYQRIASVQSSALTAALGSGLDAFLAVLIVLGALLLIVQGAFLVFGGFLARQITSAIHELFIGTERVQQGDFTHRIAIQSRDQLGDLAESFNRMSASIEHLLHVQREKQRLDDELRIAREIQKSLLPSSLPVLAGLGLADLCEPAREVGGDYYDFFDLGSRRLGVLVADVAGKGTSAALYMAELKGLMLALSRQHRSPRRLMIEINDLLAAHLDNRSFITMIYAVIDLDAGTLTFARAGHTPLLVVKGGAAEFIVPDGMVLGLRLPGAGERFTTVLREHESRIAAGDVIVLYTDGVTEAMNADGDLFGESALAKVVEAHHDLDAAGIRERILRDVKAFVGEAEPHDDMTMIVVKIDSPPAGR